MRDLPFSGRARLGAWLLLAATTAPAIACGPGGQQSTICLFRDTINKPESRSQRRALMAQGLSKFCDQMKSHNAPLRLAPDAPVIGRYYPTDCKQREVEGGDLFVEFSGYGYAWTNLSKKMTFTMAGAVEYNQDFLIAKDECDLYAYFRTRRVASSDFRIHRIEAQLAAFVNALSPRGENFGRQLVAGKLTEGFTVIHDHKGSDDFGLGIVELGRRPAHPIAIHGSDRIAVESNRTEIHQNQRDFIGPIEISESGRALFLTAQVEGAPAVDLMIYGKDAAEQALRLYFEYPQSGPIPAPPVHTEVVAAGAPFSRAVPLPRGWYYVVLDNTATAGPTNPPGGFMDDRAATVSYGVQIGDAP